MSEIDFNPKNDVIEISIEPQKDKNIKINLQEHKHTEETKENVNLQNNTFYQNIPQLDNYQNNIKKIKSERNYGIDLLRLLSSFMIVILHVLKNGGILKNCKKYSISYYLAWLLETIAYSSVENFGLISGYVMVNLKIVRLKIIILWLNVFFYCTIIVLLYRYIYFFSKFEKASRYDLIKNIIFPTASR